MYTYLGEYNVNKRRPAMIAWVSLSVGAATLTMACECDNFSLFFNSRLTFSTRLLDFIIQLEFRALLRLSNQTMAAFALDLHSSRNNWWLNFILQIKAQPQVSVISSKRRRSTKSRKVDLQTKSRWK